MTICTISSIAVCGGEIPVAEAESVGMSTERLQRIGTAMQRHIDAGKIQGAVTAVARRGKAERGTLASYIPTLGGVALDFQPGSRWAYSGGTGLDVVARVVEIVSGTPYDEFVQTRIFDTVSVVLDPIAADSRRSAGAFGWGGAFGTVSWTDPAEELTGVIMLQQPYGPAQYDFENAVRQAIID